MGVPESPRWELVGFLYVSRRRRPQVPWKTIPFARAFQQASQEPMPRSVVSVATLLLLLGLLLLLVLVLLCRRLLLRLLFLSRFCSVHAGR